MLTYCQVDGIILHEWDRWSQVSNRVAKECDY